MTNYANRHVYEKAADLNSKRRQAEIRCEQFCSSAERHTCWYSQWDLSYAKRKQGFTWKKHPVSNRTRFIEFFNNSAVGTNICFSCCALRNLVDQMWAVAIGSCFD